MVTLKNSYAKSCLIILILCLTSCHSDEDSQKDKEEDQILSLTRETSVLGKEINEKRTLYRATVSLKSEAIVEEYYTDHLELGGRFLALFPSEQISRFELVDLDKDQIFDYLVLFDKEEEILQAYSLLEPGKLKAEAFEQLPKAIQLL